jgi:hypothetical protein
MSQLTTVYSSNIPIDCHVVGGRLESNGVRTYIFDEQLVGVDPFYAVAIGGVKLKVNSKHLDQAKHIIALVKDEKLTDGVSEFNVNEELESAYVEQEKVLKLKSDIRSTPLVLESDEIIKADFIAEEELKLLVDAEKEFQIIKNRKFSFDKKEFWIRVFEGGLIDYFRIRPNTYYLEKDLVEVYEDSADQQSIFSCPDCDSSNFRYGYAIGFDWDILYLILSLLIITPFPMIRKRFHCYNCNEEFRKRDIVTSDQESH